MRRFFVILLFVFAMVSMATADVLTFDTLPTTSGAPVPNGYGGLTYQLIWYLDNTTFGGTSNGYVTGAVSGTNVAFIPFLGDIWSPTFTFNSAYFTGAWGDGVDVHVEGWLAGNPIFSKDFVVNMSGPTLETFGWTVDHLHFVGSDPEGKGAFVVMDNFDYTLGPSVPEPASLVLLGSGVLALVRKLRKHIA